MIPTNKHLPLFGASSVPAIRREHELQDECSGIAELRQHERGGAVAAVALLSAAFLIGMLAGATIVFGLVVIFTK